MGELQKWFWTGVIALTLASFVYAMYLNGSESSQSDGRDYCGDIGTSRVC